MLQLSNQYVTEVSLPDEPKKNWEGGAIALCYNST
jgi:hypothetical protein